MTEQFSSEYYKASKNITMAVSDTHTHKYIDRKVGQMKNNHHTTHII